MTRPPTGCVHMAQNPDQCSMYYSWKATNFETREFCLPCIVEIKRQTQDSSLNAGVAMEISANAGRVLPRKAS